MSAEARWAISPWCLLASVAEDATNPAIARAVAGATGVETMADTEIGGRSPG